MIEKMGCSPSISGRNRRMSVGGTFKEGQSRNALISGGGSISKGE